MSTAYNCECRFKVEWEDLAPSLQARFRNIENDLINVHNSINTINKNIQNIENNIDVIEGNIIQNENKINNLTNINNTTLQNLNNVLTNINNLNKNYQNINNTVSNMNNTVNNINQNYQNINNQVTNIQKVQEEAVDGLNGQVLKVNAKSKKMYAHDEIIFVDCVTNQLELEKAMTKKPISMQEIFNNWYRYAHFCAAAASQLDNTNNSGIPDGQNRTDNTQFTAYTDPTKGGWTFDQATDTIHNNFDYNVSAGFINPEDKYSSFYLKVRADTGWDDDHINIIVGYMRDSSGVEHTLTLARGAGLLNGQTTLDTKFLWGLIYDANNPTQFFINDLSSKTTPRSANGGSHNICYMTAIRSNTLMEFRTTDWDPNGNAKTDIKGLTFQFKYPDSKPSNWTQAMYDNIGVMMKNPNRIGFGARSTTGWFRIEEQDGIMSDQDIYDFQNDVIYHYDFFNNRWVKRTASDSNFTKPSEKFSDRTFIYNERTQKLYYYYYKGRIIPLDTQPSLSNISASNNLPEEYNFGKALKNGMVYRADTVNNTAYWEDYFFIKRITSSSSDTTIEKDMGIDLSDVFNKWKRISSRNGTVDGTDASSDADIRNAYGYNKTYNMIYNKLNSDPASGFISLDNYQNNWEIKIQITNNPSIFQGEASNDDDALFIICGIFKDSSGLYRDVSVVRIGGSDGQWDNYEFLIMLDCMNNITAWNNINRNNGVLASLSLPKRRWGTNNCFLKVKKSGSTIEAWTSDIDTTVTDINPNYHISYTIPNSKPSNLTDDQWKALNYCITKECQIGFGTCSNSGGFMINSQKFIFEDEIISLEDDIVWRYVDGVWIQEGKVSNTIPPRSLLYNKTTKRLFWYVGPGNYEEIKFS